MNTQNKIPVLQLQKSIIGFQIEKVDSSNFDTLIKDILHRDDYHLCIVSKSGSLDFVVEFEPVKVVRNTLLFINPGQLHYLKKEQKFLGWMLLFDARYVDDQSEIVFEQLLNEQPLTGLSIKDCKFYNHILEAIYSITSDHRNPDILLPETVEALLSAFIYKTASIFRLREKNNVERHSPRAIEITKNLIRMVRKYYKSVKSPSDYASRLHLSLSYLNDTIRSVTGFSVTHYIQQEIIREAQRLLCKTDLNIREISYELGYDDEKYFNRLFTKINGRPPGVFRKEWSSNLFVKNESKHN